MIKIAYLLMCHKNADQVNNLIDVLLNNESASVFVHVDKRSDIFDKIKVRDRLFLLSNRLICRWGRIDQVNVMKNLIDYAYNVNPNFDYYQFVSGECFPIKSVEYINNYLEERNGYSFIDINELHGKNSPYYYRSTINFSQFYLNNLVTKNFFIKTIKKIELTIKKAYKNNTQRQNFDYHFGSSWVTLNKNLIEYIIKEYNFQHFIDLPENSFCFDECVFQTIAMNSPLKDKVINHCLTYVNFNDAINASYLDFEQISTDCLLLFARKVRYPIDERIVELSEGKRQ